jgi:hypothetical protein
MSSLIKRLRTKWEEKRDMNRWNWFSSGLILMHVKDKPQTFGMVENWNTNFSIRCWVNLGISDTSTEA